jgi:hypothetical protein
MYISKPSSLSASSISDITHLTSIYDQLTDGVHDISISSGTFQNISCQSISSSNNLFFSFDNSKYSEGDYSENIDNILKQGGLNPEDFENKIIKVNGTNYSNQYSNYSAIVMSHNGL